MWIINAAVSDYILESLLRTCYQIVRAAAIRGPDWHNKVTNAPGASKTEALMEKEMK